MEHLRLPDGVAPHHLVVVGHRHHIHVAGPADRLAKIAQPLDPQFAEVLYLSVPLHAGDGPAAVEGDHQPMGPALLHGLLHEPVHPAVGNVPLEPHRFLVNFRGDAVDTDPDPVQPRIEQGVGPLLGEEAAVGQDMHRGVGVALFGVVDAGDDVRIEQGLVHQVEHDALHLIRMLGALIDDAAEQVLVHHPVVQLFGQLGVGAKAAGGVAAAHRLQHDLLGKGYQAHDELV